MPPTDPLLYRLYEVLLVFGQPIKAVIHEVSTHTSFPHPSPVVASIAYAYSHRKH